MIKVKSCTPAMTSTGKPYKKLEVECESEFRWVNMFSNFPNFANIKEGSEFEAKMEKKGNYWNLVLDSVVSRGANFKNQQIEKVMEKKAESITHFQDNKELGIKTSSTIRMAVDIATSLTTDQWHGTTMEEEIRFWREWLWGEWDKVGSDTMPPF